MKATMFIVIAATLQLMTGCGTKQNDSTSQLAESQTKPEPPEMDLHTATFLGDLKVIEQHITAGSDLNEREPSVGSTALISASVFGRTEVVRILIEAGADVNLQNQQGSTALHSAAFLCRTEIVKMLLENGARKDFTNIFGSTPLASVSGPFNEVKSVYDQFSKDLGPLGLKLDYSQIEATRPVIAEMLK